MKTQTLTSDFIPPYIAYPRFLFELNISETSKMIYSLLLDRARISFFYEEYKDDLGEVFVFFTVKSLSEMLGKSEISVKRCLKSLEENELIKRENQGFCKANKIFVKVPQGIENDTHTGIKNDTHISIKNDKPQVSKMINTEYQKRYPSNNKYNNNKYNNKKVATTSYDLSDF